MSTSFDPAENDLPQVPPAEATETTETTETTEASGNNDTLEHLNGETLRDSEREDHITSSADETPSPSRRRKARGARSAHGEQPAANSDGILRLPVRRGAQPAKQGDESDEAAVVAELEAQGFTADEAIRLVHESDRVANLSESREALATLRRLRFTRWLIERGVLDEFSA